MNTNRKNSDLLLLVEDESFNLALLEACIAKLGHNFVTAQNGIEALKQLESFDINIIITDLVMPEMDGMELLQVVVEKYPHIDVIVQTAQTKDYTYTDVIKAGATDFIEKPFSTDELSAKLKRVLREQKNVRELLRANKSKSDFLNTMSHEFLTPMNGIIGFANLLKETELSQKQQEYLDLITVSSDRLMLLVNQLLYFSEIQDSETSLKITMFSMDQLFQEILPSFLPSASEKRLSLNYTIHESVPMNLHGDRDVFIQIVSNLIDNAIKYSDRGKIEINIKIDKELGSDDLLLRCSVKDTGQGVPLDKQKDIFKAFTQGEDYLTRRQDGAGLGLAICKKLVKLLNGSIWLESKEDKGTTFHFTAKFRVVPGSKQT